MSAKNLIVKVIKKPAADDIVKRLHYSGKVIQNSQINFGIFLNDKLIGAAQFGPSIDKRRMGQSLGIGMNESIELNRLAIDDIAGKNSESRVLGICLRMIKAKYPFIRCVVSFADACQCGDGTIYRASGFRLHSYKKNTSLLELSDEALAEVRKFIPKAGRVTAKKSLDHHLTSNGAFLSSAAVALGAKPLSDFQMKYIYYFDKDLEKSHTFIPFDKIPKEVRMYKGNKRGEHEINASGFQLEEGGAIPTSALQSKREV